MDIPVLKTNILCSVSSHAAERSRRILLQLPVGYDGGKVLDNLAVGASTADE